MPHSYDYNPGAAQGYKDFSTRGKIIFWLIMIFLVTPFCGFFVGLTGMSFLPSLAYLTAPAVCSQGALQVHQYSVSGSYQASGSVHYDCVNSQTGKTSDVTESVISVGGLAVAVLGSILLALTVILISAIRFLIGQQTTS